MFPFKSTSLVDSDKLSSFEPGAATSAETPLDGAAELQEEEMERSVFGMMVMERK